MLLFHFSKNLFSNLVKENRLINNEKINLITPEQIIKENRQLNPDRNNLKDLSEIKDNLEFTDVDLKKGLLWNLEAFLKEKVYTNQSENLFAKRHAAELRLALHEQLQGIFINGAVALDILIKHGSIKIAKISLEKGNLKFYDDDGIQIKFESGDKTILKTDFEARSRWEGEKISNVEKQTKENLSKFSESILSKAIETIRYAQTQPDFYSGKKYNGGVYQLQCLLSSAGYNPSYNNDGQWGRTTRVAMRNFQRENGLTETDRLNDATLAKLQLYLQEPASERQITGRQFAEQYLRKNYGADNWRNASPELKNQKIKEFIKYLKTNNYPALTETIKLPPNTALPENIPYSPLFPADADTQKTLAKNAEIDPSKYRKTWTARLFSDFLKWGKKEFDGNYWQYLDGRPALENVLRRDTETFSLAFSTSRNEVPDPKDRPKDAAFKRFIDYIKEKDNFENSESSYDPEGAEKIINPGLINNLNYFEKKYSLTYSTKQNFSDSIHSISAYEALAKKINDEISFMETHHPPLSKEDLKKLDQLKDDWKDFDADRKKFVYDKHKTNVITLDHILKYVGLWNPYGLTFKCELDLNLEKNKAEDALKRLTSNKTAEIDQLNQKIKDINTVIQDAHELLFSINNLRFDPNKVPKILSPAEIKNAPILQNMQESKESKDKDDLVFIEHLSLEKLLKKGSDPRAVFNVEKDDELKINLTKKVQDEFSNQISINEHTSYPSDMVLRLILAVYDLNDLKKENCVHLRSDGQEKIICLTKLPANFKNNANNIKSIIVSEYHSGSGENDDGYTEYGYDKGKAETLKESLLGNKKYEYRYSKEIDAMFNPDREPEIADKTIWHAMWRGIRGKERDKVTGYRMREGTAIERYKNEKGKISGFSEFSAGINDYLKKQISTPDKEGYLQFNRDLAKRKFTEYVKKGLDKPFLNAGIDFSVIADDLSSKKKLQQDLKITPEELKQIEDLKKPLKESKKFLEVKKEMEELKNPHAMVEDNNDFLFSIRSFQAEFKTKNPFLFTEPLLSASSLPEYLYPDEATCNTINAIAEKIYNTIDASSRDKGDFRRFYWGKFKKNRKKYLEGEKKRTESINKIQPKHDEFETQFKTNIDQFTKTLRPILQRDLESFLNGDKKELNPLTRTFFETGLYAETVYETAVDSARVREHRKAPPETITYSPENFPMDRFIDNLKEAKIDIKPEEIAALRERISRTFTEAKVGQAGVIFNETGVKAAAGTVVLPVGEWLSPDSLKITEEEELKARDEAKAKGKVEEKDIKDYLKEYKKTLLRGLTLECGIGYGQNNGQNVVGAIINPRLQLTDRLGISTGFLTNFKNFTANLSAFDVRVPIGSKDWEIVFSGGFAFQLNNPSTWLVAGQVGARKNPAKQAQDNASDIQTKQFTQFIDKVKNLEKKINATCEKLPEYMGKTYSPEFAKHVKLQLMEYMSRQAQVAGADRVKGVWGTPILGGGVKLIGGPKLIGGIPLPLPVLPIPYVEFLVGSSTRLAIGPDNVDQAVLEETIQKARFEAAKKSLDGNFQKNTIAAAKLQFNTEGKIDFASDEKNQLSELNLNIAGFANKTHQEYSKMGLDVDYLTGEEEGEKDHAGLLRLEVHNSEGPVEIYCGTNGSIKLWPKTVGDKHYIYLNVGPTAALNIARLDRNSLAQEGGAHNKSIIIIRDLNQDYQSLMDIQNSSKNFLQIPGKIEKNPAIITQNTGKENGINNIVDGFAEGEIQDYFGGLKESAAAVKQYQTLSKSKETYNSDQVMDITDEFWKNPDNPKLFKKLSTERINYNNIDLTDVTQNYPEIINIIKKIAATKKYPLNSAAIDAILFNLTIKSFLDRKEKILSRMRGSGTIDKKYQDADLSDKQIQAEIMQNENIRKKVNAELQANFDKEINNPNSFTHKIIKNLFLRQGKTLAEAEEMKNQIIDYLKPMKFENSSTRKKIAKGTDIYSLVGTDQITGGRLLTVGDEEYHSLFSKELSFTNPDDQELANTALNLLSGLPEKKESGIDKKYIEKFLDSRLSKKIMGIAPLIFEGDVAKKVLDMYNKPDSLNLDDPTIQAFQNFENLIRRIREGEQSGEKEISIAKLITGGFTGLNSTLKPVLHLTTNASTAIVEECSNPSFALLENIQVEFQVGRAAATSAMSSLGLHVLPYDSETNFYTLDTSLMYMPEKKKKPEKKEKPETKQEENGDVKQGGDGGDIGEEQGDKDDNKDHGGPGDSRPTDNPSSPPEEKSTDPGTKSENNQPAPENNPGDTPETNPTTKQHPLKNRFKKAQDRIEDRRNE